MKGERIYQRLPVFLQNLACSFYGMREARVRRSSVFWEKLRELEQSESSSADEIADHQAAELQKLIRHAYQTVPYYRLILDQHGIRPNEINIVDDLAKLPLLTKKDVRERKADLISVAHDRARLAELKTSGTTGSALSFFTTRDAIAFQWAVWWRHRGRFGVTPESWHVNFTGKKVVPIGQSRPPYWRWNWPMHQVLVGMQHITKAKIRDIARFLGSQDFVFYAGYPSIIASLCELIEREGLDLDKKARFVFLGAENVQEYQRAVIERVTGAIVTDQYGFSEGCGNASRCEHGNYHEDWEFGILECVDPEVLPDGSIRGKVVATGFANHAFPFIRYEVGDTAIWAPENYRCPCGRNSRVIRFIDGRNEDYVLTPEGGKVMRFSHLFKDTDEIREAQVVQERLGEIVIRVALRDGKTFDPEALRKKVKEMISPGLKVEFETVKEIPRTAAGKFKHVVSMINKTANS